jgi:hypothetical protein
MTDNEVNAILPEHLPVDWLRHLWVLYGNFDSRIINNYTEHQVREMWTNETRHYLPQTAMNARSMLIMEIPISEKKDIYEVYSWFPKKYTYSQMTMNWCLGYYVRSRILGLIFWNNKLQIWNHATIHEFLTCGTRCYNCGMFS